MSPSSEKPRVVHLLNSLETGGIETQLVAQLPHLSAVYEMKVVTLRKVGPLAEAVEKCGAEVIHCPVERGGWWTKIHRLAECLEGLKPEIVHAHSRFPALVGLPAALSAGVPRRIAHYYTMMSKRAWNNKALERNQRLFGRRNQLLFCSEDVRDDFIELIPEAARLENRIVPCGIDVAEFSPGDPDRRAEERKRKGIGEDVGLIGIVARLAPVKNHGLLLQAARILKKRGTKFRL